MERKIGEIFEYNGEWYQCVVATQGCRECSFRTQDNCKRFSECFSVIRSDKKSVIFKKLEKVGEPYVGNNGTFQSYKLAMPIYGDIPDQIIGFTTTEVVIKQNKEDMEEKKIQLRQEDVDWLKDKIRWSVLPGYSIAYEEDYDKIVEEMMKLFTSSNTKHSNSENIEKNLKPFNLEAAKAGKPVCTRDGRKARIICFDRNDLYPIVALIECEDGKEIIGAYSKEGQTEIYEIKGTDLMMLPEKKEGWVNVYKDGLLDTKSYNTKKEAFDKASPRDYVDTVKINWEE